MNYIIYHNNRCSKSREVLKFLQEKKINLQVIEYLKTPFSFQDLKNILKVLNINPIDIVRQNEVLWKSVYKHKFLSKKIGKDELINILIQNQNYSQ